jgi:hypothetical protein
MTTPHPLLTKKSVGSLLGIATTLLGVVVANMTTASDVQETVLAMNESINEQRAEIRGLSASDSMIRDDLSYLKDKAMSDSIRTVIEEEFEKRYKIQVARIKLKKEVTYAKYED